MITQLAGVMSPGLLAPGSSMGPGAQCPGGHRDRVSAPPAPVSRAAGAPGLLPRDSNPRAFALE